MERAMLLALLARAEQHIALGKEQINKQYRIIAKLESDGHDTARAVELLKQFIETNRITRRIATGSYQSLRPPPNKSSGADGGVASLSFFRLRLSCASRS